MAATYLEDDGGFTKVCKLCDEVELSARPGDVYAVAAFGFDGIVDTTNEDNDIEFVGGSEGVSRVFNYGWARDIDAKGIIDRKTRSLKCNER